MLFNSFEFLFAFLPVTLLGYFLTATGRLWLTPKGWLLVSSLFFYAWWDVRFLPLLIVSIAVNFLVGAVLAGNRAEAPLARRSVLGIGLAFNLGLLGYFKYFDFFLDNVGLLLGSEIDPIGMILPLGISFFTFQQITYLVDCFRSPGGEHRFSDYAVFVSFFPQLIAGPIVHHSEMMPQFERPDALRPDAENMANGLYVFSMGLAKKVLVADTFAVWASRGFDGGQVLGFFEAWGASLSYTMQLYFDFSGYTDMAIGAALMFNVRLPANFLSPYKSTDLQLFWRRWHMTLGRFLSDYVYKPLGGNRRGMGRTLANLFATFLVGGIWHGAGWTFVAWGALHGVGIVFHRLWSRSGRALPRLLAWFVTFNFVNACWVFFRATDFARAVDILRSMLGLHGFALHSALEKFVPWLSQAGVEFAPWPALPDPVQLAALLSVAFVWVTRLPNSMELMNRFQPNLTLRLATTAMLFASILGLNRISEFLYFQF